MEVGLKIVTGRNVALRFDEFPEQARENLRDVIADATSRLAEMVRAKVPKRTGKLAGEIKSRTVEGPHNVTGIVDQLEREQLYMETNNAKEVKQF